MKVSLQELKNTAAWEKAGVRLPKYDIAAMREKTKEYVSFPMPASCITGKTASSMHGTQRR